MLDKFDRKLEEFDLILHYDCGNIFMGLVVEVKPNSLWYIIIQDKYYHCYKYNIRRSSRVVKIDITDEILNATFRDYTGYPGSGTIKDAITFTRNEYINSK